MPRIFLAFFSRPNLSGWGCRSSWQMQAIYLFDEFRVEVAERQLVRAGALIPLTPKVFDLLLALLENSGRTLTKEELAARLWPDTPVVDDANLSRNVFLLRKALRDGEHGRRLIETVPKRGYRFVAALQAPAAGQEIFPPPPADLSAPLAIPVTEALEQNERAPHRATPAAKFFRARYLRSAFGLALLLACGAALYPALYPGWSSKTPQRGPTNKAEAQQLYLQGRHLWNKRTPESFQKGLALFRQAIDLDPTCAPAHAGLADCYAGLGGYQLTEAQEAFPKAKAAAQRALELDESLAEAHITLAQVLYLYDWDFAAAEREFRRGLELNPNYATAHQWYSQYLTGRQRYDEALQAIRRARALDPLAPIIATTEGGILYHARRYDEALASLRKTLAWEPGYPAALTYLAMAHTEKTEYDAALQCYEQARAALGDDLLLPGLAYVNARAGRHEAARRLIAQMKTKAYFAPIYWALVYAGVGEYETALQWLEQGRTERNSWLPLLPTDPRFDGLRATPHFRQWLSAAGLG